MRIVIIENESERIVESSGGTLLESCLTAGVKVPYRCASGNCGLCRARLRSGKVVAAHGKASLAGAPAASCFGALESSILLCQVRAASDVVIELPCSAELTRNSRSRRLPCRIESAELLAHDVLRVLLKLPAAENFTYRPGQCIDVLLPGARRRSFSIASWPSANHRLELHVRRVAGGEFTESLFAQPRGTDLRAADPSTSKVLTIEGPLGEFTYRDHGRPVLMLGGGTGIAPLLCMLRFMEAQGRKNPTQLFWGCRTRRDLYMHAELQQFDARAAWLDYTPVLSQAEPDWQGARGLVHAAALDRVADPRAHDVYLSGPPQMIAAALAGLRERGVPEDQILADPFTYSTDALAFHAAKAAAKS